MSVLDLGFRPDRARRTPLHRQLSDYLRELVDSGRLEPGEKLPATRELASSVGVGRKTANQAYQSLIDDGVLLAHVGQGTFVSSRAAAVRTSDPARPEPAQRPFAWEAIVSRASDVPLPRGIEPAQPSVAFDFLGGRIDAASVPVAALRRAYSAAIAKVLPGAANEADPLGHPPLRAQIARLLISRGIRCGADEVLVTAGAQEAIELVSRVLVDPGDVVAIEQPGYFGSAMALQAAGARLLGIEVDGEGLRTDAVARAARSHRLKLVYTTPAAQMPTGAVLSESRRSALLEIADATQTPILEDDYDCEFRRDGAALPALKTRDRAGQVIYVGTFSKSLFPALRLGYVVAAPALLGRLAMTRFAGHLGLDLLGQAALAELLESGSFERHVRRLRRRYAQRREALQSALEESMPAGTRWSRSQGGLLTWVQLPAEVDGRSLRERASERGIVYHPGETFRIERGGAQEFALSFASQPPERIVEGIHELGRIARSLARRRHG